MQIVVLDLDGTLLRDDKTVSERNLRALHEHVARGGKVVIATARPPRMTLTLLPSLLNDLSYFICYNGAEAYYRQRRIYKRHIPQVLLKQILQWLDLHIPYCRLGIEHQDTFYTTDCLRHLFGPNLDQTLIAKKGIDFLTAAKIILDLTNVSDLAAFIEHFSSLCQIVVTDGGTLAQIMAPGVSKVATLQHILEKKWSLSLSDAIAFGDDTNDLEMITQCGVGVAMANAVSALKDVADVMTCSNNEDGVAAVLECLRGPR